MLGFKNLIFGYSAAETEIERAPELLIDGFYDLAGEEDSLQTDANFVVMGYKGSGKSAIAQRLSLLSDRLNPGFMAQKPITLEDFPFTQFRRIVLSEGEPESRFPLAWQLLLIVLLIDQMKDDATADGRSRLIMADTFKKLSQLNMNPSSRELPTMVKRTAKTTFSSDAARVFGYSREVQKETREASLTALHSHLLHIVTQFRSKRRHLLLIDGLDDLLRADSDHLQVLSGLLSAAGRLNKNLTDRGISAKVVVLCRTDLFERLPGGNKNKIRQDSTLELDWYDDTRQPLKSHIVQMLNRRAALADPFVTDIFRQYFPSRIDNRSSRSWLLALTRHTPRDAVQLMRYIQDHSKSEYEVLSRELVLAGAREYSRNYLLPEMKDELNGVISPAEHDLTFAFLGAMRRTIYTIGELKELQDSQARFKSLDLESALENLFECSAIGNKIEREEQEPFFVFRYRNPRSSLSLEHRVVLHRGLYKELILS